MPRSDASDLELVARAHARVIRTNGGSDRTAMQAALCYYQKTISRHGPEEARRRVSDLIVEAVGKGLVWGGPAPE
jgi:hypothetical protein